MGVVVNTQDRETQPGLCIHVLLAFYNIPSSCPLSSPSQPLSVLAMVKAETLANSWSEYPKRPGLTHPCCENRLRVLTEVRELAEMSWVQLSSHVGRLHVTVWIVVTHHHCLFTVLLLL